MKICRIVDFFPSKKEILGDLGPNYYYYAKGTTEKGFKEYIICSRKKGQAKEEEINGLTVLRVAPADVPHPRRDLLYGQFARKSLEAVLKIKPDIVHGHNSLHYAVAAKKAKLEEKGIKLITHLHILMDMFRYAEHLPLTVNLPFALRERFTDLTYFIQFLKVVKNADLIIACDNCTKQSVLRHEKGKPIEVIYNGVDTNKFKKVKSDLKQNFSADKLLLNISRPVPWKGLQHLIKALPDLNKRFDLACLFVGARRPEYGVYLNWLESIARKHKVENVHFLERVSYFELPAYYSGADCFVAPSYPDPSPKTVYEAQACNTPVVGVDGGGIPEIFSQHSGLLCKPKNSKDLAEKIALVLENQKKFQGGREIVKKKATWQQCVDKMVQVYEKLA